MRTLPEKRMSLLTKPEAELVLSSAPRNISELDTRQLKSRIQRSRRLISKYQAQARTQRREATGRITPTRSRRAEGAANTKTKQQYFELSLVRFEKQLEKLDRQKAREAAARKRAAATTRAASSKRAVTARRAAAAKRPAAAKRSATAKRAATKTRVASTKRATTAAGASTRSATGTRRASKRTVSKGHATARAVDVHGKATPAKRGAKAASTRRTAAKAHATPRTADVHGKAQATSPRGKARTTGRGSTAPGARKGVVSQRQGGARKQVANLATQRKARASAHGRRTQGRRDAR